MKKFTMVIVIILYVLFGVLALTIFDHYHPISDQTWLEPNRNAGQSI
nr:MAG TPA: cortexin-like protein [Caudoviricetes sp.]